MDTKDKIEEYLIAKHQMQHFKALEKKLRIELLQTLWPDANDTKHTTSLSGYSIKGKFSNSIALTSDFDTVKYSLTAEELDCISHKPSLSVSKYKKLTDSQRTTLDECIVVKASLPTLEIDVE